MYTGLFGNSKMISTTHGKSVFMQVKAKIQENWKSFSQSSAGVPPGRAHSTLLCCTTPGFITQADISSHCIARDNADLFHLRTPYSCVAVWVEMSQRNKPIPSERRSAALTAGLPLQPWACTSHKWLHKHT